MSDEATAVNREKGSLGERASEFGISKTRYAVRYLKIWFLGKIVELIPLPSWRAVLHRMRGINIGKNVHIGFEVLFDRVYPHLITIEDDVVIGDRCIITAHSALVSKVEPVCIQRKACIMPGVIITAGVTIGAHATVGTGAVVREDVPEQGVLVPTPSRLIPPSLIKKADQYQ